MNKQELFKEYQDYLDQGIAPDMIILDLHMPGGETENIINPNVAAKMDYIDRTYDDNLRHKNCPDIYITEALFIVPDDGLLDFSDALINIREGNRVSRKGWNGKGMYVFLANNIQFDTDADISEFNGFDVSVSDLLVLRTAQGTFQPGWLATQSDLLADDWYVLTDDVDDISTVTAQSGD